MPAYGRELTQLFFFGLIGVVGFVVDAGVLTLALSIGLGLYGGRILSYLTAVTCTWALNRRFTFRQTAAAERFRQWRRFALSQLTGATINLGTYAVLVRSSRVCAQHPVIAVAVGSLLGLLGNYLAARRFVFAQ